MGGSVASDHGTRAYQAIHDLETSMRKFVVGICVASLAGPAAALDCAVKSGPGTAALVELYTSEGCSSCPPADRWLRGIRGAGLGADRVVPLSLHVDYWDYIGWKDLFAQGAFTSRQREVAAARGSGVVYTPQVVLGGRDYRDWTSSRQFTADVRALNDRPARAQIALALKSGSVAATASLANGDQGRDTALFVAVYENGLSNRVSAGENHGATLTHDYVVREWFGPFAFEGGKPVEVSRPIAASTPSGVAAFVQNRRTGEVLQATMCGG
jgi:hypothetical protein